MPINCEKCNAPNRDIAKYCKRCGEELMTGESIDLNALVGLGTVKTEISNLVNISRALKSRTTGGSQRINMHTIIIGNTGTGKSLIGGVLQNLFYNNGLIGNKNIELVDAVDFEKYMEEFDENIKKAKGGILFVDNVQKLVPGGYASDVSRIDKLFSEMDKFGFDPIVILAGLPGGTEDFLEKNPSIRNRFNSILRLSDYNLPELLEICRRNLQKYNLQLNEDSQKRLKGLFKYAVKHKTAASGNGHFAVNVAEDIFKAYLSRISKGDPDNNVVKPEDIIGQVEEERTYDEVMAELDEFIGMPAVKNAVKEIAQIIGTSKSQKERGIDTGMKLSMHTILTGNPGTGKTTVARKLGEIFAALDFLESGHVIEVDKSHLVSPYKNETAKTVNQFCDQAMGGILFVDEAYTLYQGGELGGGGDDHGKEAVETLMKRMEDDRDKFVVIAAGYKNEMDNFLKANPGIKSRIDRFLHIDDYTPDELFDIYAMNIKKKKFVLHPETEEIARKAITEIYDARDNNFGNGREMRKLFETTVSRFSKRISTLPYDQQTREALTTIMPEDLPYEAPKEAAVDEIMAELNELKGLGGVKKEITSLINYLNLEKKKIAASGGKLTVPNLNFVFTGNPGTGKTTVARILAKVFKNLGLLTKGHLVEVDSSKLVAGFSGQTSIKTNELIDSAMGGLLFLDEAYTLSDGTEFGQQAINTLLKRMEDDRGRFITIAAGYTNEMREFINTNPGLQSRFTRYVEFEDFKADELLSIFKSMAAKKSLRFDNETEEKLLPHFKQVVAGKDKNFGNAREVRNIFDSATLRQSARVTELDQQGKDISDEMYTLRYVDISGDDSKVKSVDEIIAELDQFVGMEKVKDACYDVAEKIKLEKERVNRGLSEGEKVGLHFVITGNPGTGKTTVARKLGEIFKAIGFLPKGHVIEVDRSGLVGQHIGETPHLVSKQVELAMGGILFVDEAYTLVPAKADGGSNNYGQEAVETIMKRMEDDRGRFVLIAAGYEKEMENFLEANPGMRSRFDKYIHLDDYNEEQLHQIFIKGFAKRKKYSITPEADEKLKLAIKDLYSRRDKNFANAREMRKLFDEVTTRLSRSLSSKPFDELTDEDYTTIRVEHIPEIEGEQKKSLEEILAGLDKFVGMDKVKVACKEIAERIKIDKERVKRGLSEGEKVGMHLVLTGNPGTGKTTVARTLGEIFKAIDFLPRGHVVEVDRSQMVSAYENDTPNQVNKLCDQATGGILFVDEAYTLNPPNDVGDKDKGGVQAIETLMKRMEDDRGAFVVIAAGYKDNMEGFLEANPGMRSRFDKYIHLDDYNADQLYEIFVKAFAGRKNYKISPEADVKLKKAIQKLYDERDKNFANAREMRKLFEQVTGNLSNSLSAKSTDELTNEDYTTIQPEHIPWDESQDKERTLEEIYGELNQLIGLDNIKNEVKEISNFLRIEKKRKEMGLSSSSTAYHFIFSGNPGTGKTTVARIIADVFKTLGILPKGQLVEVDRSNLVGQYQGQTEPKVNAAIDKALGGILFIDEAYTLSSRGGDDVGKIAIETLMKRMEDDRGKFICILAGYTNEMQQFLEVNPGLRSRIPKEIIFEDYVPAELLAIFQMLAKKKSMILGEGVEELLTAKFTEMYENRDKNFGNARLVRNVFEKAQQLQSSRIVALLDSPDFQKEDLVTINKEDIEL
ncbi:MAG: hypothetical protein SCALA702_36580 [Melioribacteraceae bacterium]|nr:MAG: hypothetical protein SCALA702_36580 [Melioribacteraceae bacterium]